MGKPDTVRARQRDLLFLHDVRACASLRDVQALFRQQKKPMPDWRRMAIFRALKRVEKIASQHPLT